MKTQKHALLVIDMTNDFLYSEYNGNLALERAQELIPRIRKLEEEFLDAGHPVIYVSDRHLPTDYELKKWGMHSMKGTPGSEITAGLVKEGLVTLERHWREKDVEAAATSDKPLYEVEKGTYSGFTDNGGQPTALHALLYWIGFREGDNLYLTGLHTNACDKHTAADAWFRGYHPVMVSDCTDAFDDPEGLLGMGHERALNYEKYWYSAEVIPSSEVSGRIGSHMPSAHA